MNRVDENITLNGEPATRAGQRTLILVGNPNVGKSVLFTKLTGKFVVISNYPGTTVEITRGQTAIDGEPWSVLDTPGVNELVARTEDARVTCDVLRDHPEAVIVQVADAKNLRRALLLTQQLAELNRPRVLVLNMMDELDQCGGHIDVRILGELLGVPVVPTIATAGTGIHLLQKSLAEAHVPSPAARRGSPDPADSADRQVSTRLSGDLRSPERARSGDRRTAGATGAGGTYEQTAGYLARAGEILAQTYSLTRPHRPTLAQRLGWWAIHPVKGLFLAAAILAFTFWFVGLCGAGMAVNFLENFVFARHLSPWAIRAVDAVLPFPHEHETVVSHYQLKVPLTPTRGFVVWENSRTILAPTYSPAPDATSGWWTQVKRLAHDFLVGSYGVITMALSYALAIVMPIVTTFFLVFSVLEDSGYLARLAVMLNRLFRGMGLNGKAVLPVILGLGCDTMATMTTRILETRKERVISTLLLALAIPCSAQLGVLLAMMASISFGAALFWVALMIAVTFLTGWLAARLYPGSSSDFILELPPMRRPQWENVLAKTMARLEWYLKEVIPLFVLGTALLFVLDKLGLLARIARLGEPLVSGWLGLPRDTANAFLVGFLRRDYGAVYLLDAATGPHPVLSPHQVLVAMVTITLFIPCIATVFMISRELGKKTALAITLVVFPTAFLIGGLVHHAEHWLGF